MAEEQPSLHIDTDWKKQAQEEKRKLAEQEKQRGGGAGGAAGAGTPLGAGMSAGAMPPTTGAPSSGTAASPGAPPSDSRRAGGGAASARAGAGTARGPGAGAAERELPPPSFTTLVQSLVTQILFYLGDLARRGGEPVLDLDLAKHNIDILGVLEEKTRGNLTDDEQRMLDAALYETRMRYVNLASQFVS